MVNPQNSLENILDSLPEGVEYDSNEGVFRTSGPFLNMVKKKFVEGDVESDYDALHGAGNIYIKGDVKAGRNVLYEAEDSYIEGNVKAGRNVLCEAEDSYIEGNVKAGQSALHWVEDSYVVGDVESGYNTLSSAKNSHIEGNVKAGQSALFLAENSYVVGNVEAEDVLKAAKDSYVEGNVEAEDVLRNAENSYVEGDVETREAILGEAENSYVKGDVKAGEGGTLSGAKNSHVEGDVETRDWVLPSAENSYVKGDVKAKGEVLFRAKNSHVEGNLESERVLREAENSYVEGDVETREDVLKEAKDSYVEGNVETGKRVLSRAKNSYILSDKIKTKSMGSDAIGGLAAAKELDVEKRINTGMTVISGDNTEGTIHYQGNWKDLSEFTSKQLKAKDFGKFAPLKIFKIETDKLENVSDLESKLSELELMFEQVRENYERHTKLCDVLDLGNIAIYEFNEDRYNYLKGLERQINDKLNEKLGADEKAREIILNHSQSNELIGALLSLSFEEETGIGINDFFKKYSDNKQSDFCKKYSIEEQTELDEEDIEEINQKLYSQGKELLGKIKKEGAGLDMSNNNKVKEYVGKIKELGPKIGELMRSGNRDAANDLIQRKKGLEKELEDFKINEAKKMINNYNLSDIDGLKECLSQLGQHYLDGKQEAEALEISQDLRVRGSELTSNILQASVWNKDITGPIPTYDGLEGTGYNCCEFMGWRNGIFGYIANDAVQLLKFDIGDKSAMAITAETANEDGEKVLWVDSVESKSHIFDGKRGKNVADVVTNAIEDYAKQKNYAKIAYTGKGNNANKAFYDNLTDCEPDSINLELTDDLPVAFEGNLDSCKIKSLQTVNS